MRYDILIVGAGLAGASLACALRGSRLRVALIDRGVPRLPEGWDSRVYAISPTNRDFLDACGVWPHLDASRIGRAQRMEVWGDAGGYLAFDAYESGLDVLAWLVESSRMAVELWETARRQPNVSVFAPAAAVALERDAAGVSVVLAGGERLEASLVVAADGVNSWVREALGMAADLQPYGEHGVVANFRCELPHRDTAFQWFRKDGVLAWLPLPGNQISMVWSTPEDHAAALMELDPAALSERVALAGERRLGKLELITAPAAFPLRLMKVKSVVAERVALIGDAAHAIHPLSGHGINLGFQDAKALAETVLAQPAFRDVGEPDVLQRYARKRAEEVMLVQNLTHGLNRLFRSHWPGLGPLRNAGMALTGRLPLVRGMLARYAAGLF